MKTFGSGVNSPRILNLGTVCWPAVIFTPSHLYIEESFSGTHLVGAIQCGHCRENKNLFPLPGIEQ
jgi:hypothetical protein